MRDPGPVIRRRRTGRACSTQAVDALAGVHLLDWRSELAGWEAPRLLADEIAFWDPILAKAAEPEWVPMGERTRDLLLAHLPLGPDVGVFHGDFQTNNMLFDDGRLVAVLDWEISGIGAQLLDLGWLLMMNDPESWADGAPLWRRAAVRRARRPLRGGSGRLVRLDEVAWFRALAGYRFGVISLPQRDAAPHRQAPRHRVGATSPRASRSCSDGPPTYSKGAR